MLLIHDINISYTQLLMLRLILYANHNIGQSSILKLYTQLNSDGIGISIATFYRRLNELIKGGFVGRGARGKYFVTNKGLLLILGLYLLSLFTNGAIDEETYRLALMELKKVWNLVEFSDEEVEAYLRLLFLVGKDYGLDYLNTMNIVSSLGYPKSVLLLLPDKVGGARFIMDDIIEHVGHDKEGLVKSAERVIAKAIIEYFPGITLPDGCRAVIMPRGNGAGNMKIKVLAVNCKLMGYTLRPGCPFMRDLLYSKLNGNFSSI
jgi:hypothetical protein